MGRTVENIAKYIEDKLVRILVGLPIFKELTKAQKQILTAHMTEKHENAIAYEQKLIELFQPDIINIDTDASMKDLTPILIGRKDILTTASLANGWIAHLKKFIDVGLARSFETILPVNSEI